MVKSRKELDPKKGKGRKGLRSRRTTSSSNQEENPQTRKTEIAKGKQPAEVETEDDVSDVELITRKAKGIVIGGPVLSIYELRSGPKGKGVNIVSGNKQSNSEPTVIGKKRGRGIKKSVSLTSGLNELESAPNADVIMIKGLKKGKIKKEEETDAVQVSDTDSEEACRRIKKGRNDGNGSDEDGAGGGGGGAGAGLGANMAITA